MIKVTTPAITMQFAQTSPDLTTLGVCIVTLRQQNIRYDLSSEDSEVTVAAHALTFSLTQQQTQALATTGRDNLGNIVNPVRVQANFIDGEGNRVASGICEVEVQENLNGEVVQNA